MGFLLFGVRYGMGRRGVLQILDAGSAHRSLHSRHLAIRQDGLCRRHQVGSLCIGCALCLRGIGCRIVLRGQTTTYRWRGRLVGVRGLCDQGRRDVAKYEQKWDLAALIGIRYD